MPEIRTGGYVDSGTAKGGRESLLVTILGNAGMIVVTPSRGGATMITGLGFANDDVFLNAKRGFTRVLHNLSIDLAKQIEKNKIKIGDPTDPNYDKLLIEKLSLTEANRELVLDDLKETRFWAA